MTAMPLAEEGTGGITDFLVASSRPVTVTVAPGNTALLDDGNQQARLASPARDINTWPGGTRRKPLLRVARNWTYT